jgi:TolB-like protein/Tfp pilus assembly protein PilF
MNQARWERLSAIYHEAFGRPAEKRGAFLDRACDGDAEMRAEIESLLQQEWASVPALRVLGADSSHAPEQSVAPGLVIGSYRIERALGAGGMGEVHLATDMRLNRPVALKFVGLASNHDAARRFQQETRAVSSLSHPHILTVHDSGEFSGRQYLVTEFVDGGTLKTWLGAGARTWREKVELLIGVADALATAHDAGILHRDVKPANILVAKNGYAKLADFGLAKLPPGAEAVTGPDPLTATGVVIGTINYMSPEQLTGRAIDPRSDVFSFGVVLYEALTLRHPFAAATNVHLIDGILHQAPPPIDESIPAPLREVVAKALEKDPADRYQSMRELVVDLRRMVRQSASLPVPEAARPHRLREWSMALALVALFVSAAAAATVWWLHSGPAIDSIAVVPAAAAGGNGEPLLSFGIVSGTIDSLSKVSGLKVISHGAVRGYESRPTDARTIGRELGVKAVLTVTVLTRADRVIVNLELADSTDNRFIWGERYERGTADVMTLQREIPVDIVEKLRLRLSGEQKQQLGRQYTQNREAYDLYLKGRYAWELWSEEGAKQAVAYFEEAIKRDERYTLAYAGLADVYLIGTGVGIPHADALRLAEAAARKALDLDRTLGESHAAWASVLQARGDFAEAKTEFEEAIRLSPSYSSVHHLYSHLLLLLGRIDESLTHSLKYRELDPRSPSPLGHLGYHYIYARDVDQAIHNLEQANKLTTDRSNFRLLGEAYVMKGMPREAFAAYLRALDPKEISPEGFEALKGAFAKAGMSGFLRTWVQQLETLPTAGTRNAFEIAALHARLGQKDQAFEWLERSIAVRSYDRVRLRFDFAFDSLRPDERFTSMLRKAGVPE